MNTLPKSQQIHESLTKVANTYEILTNTLSIYRNLNKVKQIGGIHQKRTRRHANNSQNLCDSPTKRTQGENTPFRGTPHFDYAEAP